MAEILDSAGMWDVTASLPEQVFDAAVAARGLEGLPNKDRIEHIVVLGMGGSGIAGDVLVAAAGPFLPIPVIVSKGYETPAYVGRAVVALASDPDVARWNGKSLSSGQLAKVYGFTDVDGSQPDAWRYLVEVQDPDKPADTTGYR